MNTLPFFQAFSGRVKSLTIACAWAAVTLAATASQSGDLLYKVVGGTEITVTGYAGSGGPVTIPSAIGGLPVTRIGTNAFEGRTELTGVLAIPDSVVSIGRQAFNGCDNLSGLTLGSGIREILFGAFAECSGLSGSLQLPGSVTNIDLYAFYGCSGLTDKLVVPDGVTAIGAAAFAHCQQLTGLVLGAGLTELGGNAFGGCTSLTGDVTIPNGVTLIGPDTFTGCSSLVNVIVGSGVTAIGEGAFEGCTKLLAVCFKGPQPSVQVTSFQGIPGNVHYVDDQPGWGASSFGGRPASVWTAEAHFNAGSGTPAYPTRTYRVGHPFDELPSATRFLYLFAGWRTNQPDLGSVITAASFVPDAIGSFDLYATWAFPFQNVLFDTQGGDAVSPTNKMVTYGSAYGELPTPTRTGFIFQGWYLDAQGAGTRITETSLVSTLSNHTLYAVWRGRTYSVTFDGQGGISPTDIQYVRYASPYGALPGSCRLGYAFGGWWTALNGTGTHITEDVLVQALANHTLYAKWTYDPQAAQSAPAGVALSLQLPGTFSAATGATVKGLPAGLKYDISTRTVTGAPTHPGSYSVTISAKGASVEQLNFVFVIEPLPSWAWGVFTGEHNRRGMCSMSISAQGKASGKLSVTGTNFTFSTTSFASGGNPVTGFRVVADARAGKHVLSLNLLLKQAEAPAPQTSGYASGSYLDGADEVWTALWRDVWKEEPALLAPYIGYYTATLAGADTYGSGYLSLTVDKNGATKVAGKLADGTAFSTSARLVLVGDEAYFGVSASPKAYKGGYAYGSILIRKPAVGKAYMDDTVYWKSNNPLATENYGGGFNRKLTLTGGWYDKLANLYGYYQDVGFYVGLDALAPTPELAAGGIEHPATRWIPGGVMISAVTNKLGVMTGLAAPKPGAPTDADDNGVWEYDANNVLALKIGLARATGIFKGSFNAWFDYGTTHTSKKLAFEGMLTPVRADTNDGIAGRGFFLWPDQALIPETPMHTYPFKWSYDFLLVVQ